MTTSLTVSLAQLNLRVGDVVGNTRRVLEAIAEARDEQQADLVVFQELTLCGYPPEDLLLHAGLRADVASALEQVREAADGIAVLVGYPEYSGDTLYNSAACFTDRALAGNYRKWCLPNYSVFDEQRYFSAGDQSLVVTIAGVQVGVTICEDVWESGPCAAAREAGAELIVSLNGSPYELGKQAVREALLAERALETGVPQVYQNLVGGQDELVFDGGSCVIDRSGAITQRAPAWDEALYPAHFDVADDGVVTPRPGDIYPLADDDASVYSALVTGVRDYIGKNGFDGIVLGLSGGIDSALTLAIAVDALGPDAVTAVMMPYHYTSDMSLEDAAKQAADLGVDYQVMAIEDMVEATTRTLAPLLAGTEKDTTEENIQSRCRGVLLMALSNKTRRIVLATGNKSEMAVGYATLYGDMAGGFAPIKDCTKTRVYALARYRNSLSPVIPERVITRPPSAELAPDQQDSDSLPPYDVLDSVLDALMIDDLSVDEIVALGYERETVGRILTMVRRNEYKRRQSSPGVRITGRAFGRDWRYPITSGYSHDG